MTCCVLLHPVNNGFVKPRQVVTENDLHAKLPQVGQQLMPLRTISQMDDAWTLMVFTVWRPRHGTGQKRGKVVHGGRRPC